jgi:hypothetical protein
MPESTTLDETLLRLHRYGPEFEGWLSNHGPMAVEAMQRRGQASQITAWTDEYVKRLDAAPGRGRALTEDEFDDALGDPRLAADWLATFRAQLTDSSWQSVLARWWPRLLPGIAAGATHGVIRVGHAVVSLREQETQPRIAELAHALGYWAMRWQRVPVVVPRGTGVPGDVLGRVPAVADQSGGIRPRLAQLESTAGYLDTAESLAPARDVQRDLESLVDAVVLRYARWAHGNPTMLVHAATAPNAVLRTLPSLPVELWQPSYAAAWSASAAVIAAYRPSTDGELTDGPRDADAFDETVAEGSEHMIKLADTALETYHRNRDRDALRAIGAAVRLGA